MLHDHFSRTATAVACFIVEPFIGSGGYILADPEYLRAARQLCDQYGVVLIFDEVISGFRFRAGDLGQLYGIQPDLATFAKIMGGGMPVAAVAGRADIMNGCAKDGGKVQVSGGTYSGHPAIDAAPPRPCWSTWSPTRARSIPHIAALGEKLRRTVEAVFAGEGIAVRCTGYPNAVVPGSSMAMPHFLLKPGHAANQPRRCQRSRNLRRRPAREGFSACPAVRGRSCRPRPGRCEHGAHREGPGLLRRRLRPRCAAIQALHVVARQKLPKR